MSIKNIRYKLVPLSALDPHVQVRLDAEIRGHLEALLSRGKDYEKAQELALQRVGCEVIFEGDEAVLCKRVAPKGIAVPALSAPALFPAAKKRNVAEVRSGVIRRVA